MQRGEGQSEERLHWGQLSAVPPISKTTWAEASLEKIFNSDGNVLPGVGVGKRGKEKKIQVLIADGLSSKKDQFKGSGT